MTVAPTFISSSPEATRQHAAEVAASPHPPLILLAGQMGAGKTHWTRGFGQAKGLSDRVSSPSYTLLNIYGQGEAAIHHFDLYRISCLEEVFDLGLFELLEDQLTCVVEWPERVPKLCDLPHLCVHFSLPEEDASESIRTIRVSLAGKEHHS